GEGSPEVFSRQAAKDAKESRASWTRGSRRGDSVRAEATRFSAKTRERSSRVLPLREKLEFLCVSDSGRAGESSPEVFFSPRPPLGQGPSSAYWNVFRYRVSGGVSEVMLMYLLNERNQLG